MTALPEKPEGVSLEDWNDVDVPELTDEEFATAVPFKHAHPDVYAAWERNSGVREHKDKVSIAFDLSADVVAAVKASGADYNTRVEKVLREAILHGEL